MPDHMPERQCDQGGENKKAAHRVGAGCARAGGGGACAALHGSTHARPERGRGDHGGRRGSGAHLCADSIIRVQSSSTSSQTGEKPRSYSLSVAPTRLRRRNTVFAEFSGISSDAHPRSVARPSILPHTHVSPRTGCLIFSSLLLSYIKRAHYPALRCSLRPPRRPPSSDLSLSRLGLPSSL